MTDLIEMNDVVTDTVVMELRIGDRVQMSLEETMVGTVTEITGAVGEIVGQGEGQVQVESSPVVLVRFDSGQEMAFGTEFLRAVSWRWQALGLKRVAPRAT